MELRLRDRPRIELVHRRALVRLEAFRRRASRGAVTLGRRAYAYSRRMIWPAVGEEYTSLFRLTAQGARAGVPLGTVQPIHA